MPTTRAHLGALTLALLSLLGSPARALEVEVQVGLNGFLVPEAWTPVRVTLHSDPDEARFEGQVVLDLPRQTVTGCAARVVLEPGSTTTVRLSVPVFSTSADYVVRVEDGQGRTVAQASPELPHNMLGDDQQLVLLIGRSSLQAFRSERDLLPRVVHLTPGAVPRDERVLACAKAIFLKGDRSAELLDLARDELVVGVLRRYVEGGGQLIVLADQSEGLTPFWLERPFFDLLPLIAVKGHATIAPRTLQPALGGMPAESVWGLQVLPKRTAANRVVCVSEPLGLGKVTVVNWDVDQEAVRSISGTSTFLQSLVREPVWRTPRLRGEELRETAREVFQASPVLGELGFAILLTCIVIHLIALGPLTSYLSRRRGPWAPLLVPSLSSIVLATTIFVGATLLRGETQAESLVFTFQHPALGRAWSQVELGLAAGASDELTLVVGEGLRPTPMSRADLDAFGFRGKRPLLEFGGDVPLAIKDVAISAGGHAHLELDGATSAEAGVSNLAPAQVSLTLGRPRQDGWAGVEVQNHGPLALQQVLLVAIGLQDTRLQLVSLQGGQTLSWDPARGELLDPSARISASPFLNDEARLELLQVLSRRLEASRHRAAAAASPLERVAFPAYWAVSIRRLELGEAVRIEGQEGAVAANCLQVSFTPPTSDEGQEK